MDGDGIFRIESRSFEDVALKCLSIRKLDFQPMISTESVSKRVTTGRVTGKVLQVDILKWRGVAAIGLLTFV